ncbi:MAG: hypothetical protein ACOY5R_06650 [Pseudomonadota bacterium]
MTLQERMTIADRQLLLADHVRQWRFRVGLSTQQAARRIPGVSHSYVEAIERAAYQPHEIPAEILSAIIRHAGPLPEGLDYFEAPPAAVDPTCGGCTEGAGDERAGPRRAPAPEGPDGPDRLPDDDDWLPQFAAQGDRMFIAWPRAARGIHLTRDELARLGAVITMEAGSFAQQHRSIGA